MQKPSMSHTFIHRFDIFSEGLDFMSYRKAMKHSIRKSRKQSKMHFGFSTLGKNERRKVPWFGTWTLTATEEEVKAAYAKYNAETERMLAENPNLVLV